MSVPLCRQTRYAFISTCMAIFLFLLTYCLDVSPAYATHTVRALNLQHPKWELQDRENAEGRVDRREGVRPLQIAVGAKLDLISALFNTSPKYVANGDTYRLAFFLNQLEERITIEVRDFDVFKEEKYHYWMLPTRKKYNSGLQTFAWDAALAQELGVSLQDLGAVARVLRKRGPYRIAPLLLQSAPFSSRVQIQGCRFTFIPNETMTVSYRISPQADERDVYFASQSEKWSKDQKSSISWNGKDRDKKAAPEGYYVLRLTATVIMSGRTETLPRDYVFYYKPDIF